MTETLKTSVSISKSLLTHAEAVAQHLNISRNHLFTLALGQFLSAYATHVQPDALAGDDLEAPSLVREHPSVIHQGDVYWVQLDDPSGLEQGIPHPHVIIQEDIFNHSRIDTVVACALTTNARRVNYPGNILLDAGEANLPKQSVVETSKVSTLEKTQLGDYIGSLSPQRVAQILAGMRFLQLSFFDR